ncbi:MAG: hypothetical protein ABSE15_00590 [Candidatus Bathyarchaeia archaeon]|jgi:hypothetical protein
MNKSLLLVLLAVSAAAFSFCGVFFIFQKSPVLADCSLLGLFISAVSMVAATSFFCRGMPSEKSEKKKAAPQDPQVKLASEAVEPDFEPKLRSTMLKASVLLEGATVLFDESQLDQVAQIVVDRSSQLRLQIMPETKPAEAAPEKTVEAPQPAETEQEAEPAEKTPLPLVMHRRNQH